jgi:hypothetical protein
MNYPMNRTEDRTTHKTRVKCVHKGCKGILFDVSSRLAHSLGVRTAQCDQCRKQFSIKIADPA